MLHEPDPSAPTSANADGLPLVLLPGTLCDHRLFASVLALLPETRVLHPRFDGTSTHEAAEALLLALPDRFALLGFSLGGIVALEVAALAPKRVMGLALLDTTARPDPAESARQRRAAAHAARTGHVADYANDLWPRAVAKANLERTDLLGLLRDMASDIGADALAHESEIAIHRADSRPRLAAITVPTLVLHGAEDAICPPDRHAEIAAAIPGARLAVIPNAGHFAPLEQPEAVARELRAWLSSLSLAVPKGTIMADSQTGKGGQSAEISRIDAPNGDVLQVERRDYPDLAPTGRARVQSMEGFDDIYTDIVDYIIRCTHRIWDERDIGLIYTHYTHNCVLYGTNGALYNREDVVRDTIQRLVSFPERRGMGTQVIWNGNDKDGFYTSHLVTGSGRHTQYGHLGAATGRPFVSRTIADCMIFQNKIYREWVVSDQMAIVKQLGLDPHHFAARTAKSRFDQGLISLDIGENRRFLGQTPPDAKADLSLAHNDAEAQTLEMLHEVFTKRMFGKIAEVYAPTVQYHGPLMKELYGIAAVIHQHLGLIGSIPDASYVPQYVSSVESEEGGVKVAVRWVMEGHHLGYGILGELGDPTGARLQVMGMSHYHWKNGKVVDEWTVYDELSLLAQVKLAALAAAGSTN